jgi:2-oxoisovalerate dehydrogenase E1 component alpha subunit
MPNRPPLVLHIPVPLVRPGETPNFTHLNIPRPGATRRPEIDTPEPELRDLPYGLIRVLSEDGDATGPWAPSLPPETLLQGLTAMLRTRLFDDRLFMLQRQGKTSFYMKSTGEEAIGAAQSLTLATDDMCFPTYRMLSWLMARDYPLNQLVHQIFSNAKDPLKGRQMPVLYSARDYGFYSLAGNLGSRFGHAVGWAMASAYKSDHKIAVGHIGEGTTAEGNFHEALTFASVYRAPVLLCITNNQWAISSFAGLAGGDALTFASKALGYGIPGLRVDGNDFLAVSAATAWAAGRARANHGPTLIEFFTYRAAGHSTSDDPSRYRPADEAKNWPLGDPIERLKEHLIHLGAWDEQRHQTLAEQIAAQVKAAVKEGEAVGTLGQSKPPVAAMFEDIFKEPDWRHLEQRRELGF